MVTSHGVVKLMDFGIAKAQVEQDLTRPGTTMGSLYYMSPEQVRGGTVDARSDIYSVGIMMYELLAGRRPFEADSAYGILNQQCNIAPQPPVEINQQLPPALSDLILCCLAKDPANRFQNAQAVNNALRQVAASMQGDAPKAEAPAFAPVAMPAAAPPGWAGAQAAAAVPSSAHRGAWITLGALLVLAVIAAAAVGLPRLLHTSAKTESEPATQASPPPPSPANPASTNPASAAPAQVPDAPPAEATGGNTVPAPVQAGDGKTTHTKVEANPKPPRPEYHPDGQTDSGNQPVSTTQSAPAGPTSEEVDQAHEQKTALDARASAVSASVDSLKRQQEADGLGLRQDMATAYALMNSYLRSASAELDSGNLNAARNHMDKADKEISILERFLGK
jgi:serine/threonine-protein kinase